jgi:DoxX-like family
MHPTYIVITILAALANAYAATLNFVGAESVKLAASHVRVSQKWMLPFGTLLGSGALGLLLGLAVPVLGTAAAAGLVLYFVCALSAHVRVGDRHVAAAISFLVLAVAALAADLAYRNHW